MIDAEGMAAFVAVAETGSFSLAADRLGVVQSVISKRLKRLEDQLGAVLVDRRNRSRIALTRLGQSYLAEAQSTLAQLHRAERIGRNLARGASGPLRIGYIFSAAMNGTLQTMLETLHRALPEIALDVKMLETPEQLAWLADGRLDIGLTRPRWNVPACCSRVVVHREPLVIGHADHVALGPAEALDPACLRGHRFIIPQFQDRFGLMEKLDKLAAFAGLPVEDPVRTADFVTAATMAAAGIGLVLAPASLCAVNLRGIRFGRISGFDELIDTVLLVRADAPAAARQAVVAAFQA